MSTATLLDRIGVGIDTARYGHRVSFLRPDRQPAAMPLTVLESRAVGPPNEAASFETRRATFRQAGRQSNIRAKNNEAIGQPYSVRADRGKKKTTNST